MDSSGNTSNAYSTDPNYNYYDYNQYPQQSSTATTSSGNGAYPTTTPSTASSTTPATTTTATVATVTYIGNDPSTLDQPITYAATVEYVVRLRNIYREIRVPILREFFNHGEHIIDGGILICHNHLGEGFVAFDTAEARDKAIKRSGEKVMRR
jgi:hypothetical protein